MREPKLELLKNSIIAARDEMIRNERGSKAMIKYHEKTHEWVHEAGKITFWMTWSCGLAIYLLGILTGMVELQFFGIALFIISGFQPATQLFYALPKRKRLLKQLEEFLEGERK